MNGGGYRPEQKGQVSSKFSEAPPKGANYNLDRWCIFRPTQIRYTPLLTYAKSAILNIRPISTCFYSFNLDGLVVTVSGPLACPKRGARPPNLS